MVENEPDKGKEFSISGRYDCNLQGSIFHTAHTLVQLSKKDFAESIKGFNEAIEENYRTECTLLVHQALSFSCHVETGLVYFGTSVFVWRSRL